MNNKKINLIICCTPLQVLLAEKIVELFQNEEFFFIFLAPVNNEKHKFYFARLKNKCSKSLYIYENKWKKIPLIFYYLKIISFDFNRIFCANDDKFFIKLILKKFKNIEINTFDDGSKNLINFVDNFSKKKRFIYDLLFKNSQIEVNQHFTIYKENIKDENNVYLNLFEAEQKENFGEEISIFLGQPLLFDDDKNKKIASNIIEKFKIQFYFPHPRENYYIDNVDYIKTQLIIEDFVLNNLQDKKIKIYTLFSSACLNLKDLPNVEITSIFIDFSNEKCFLSQETIDNLYLLFKTNNIKIMNL